MRTLPEFIELIGDKEAAKLFSTRRRPVSVRTCQSWRLGERVPRAKMAGHIVAVTKEHPHGPVTHEGIYSVGLQAA